MLEAIFGFPDAHTAAVVALGFLVGGLVKGVFGLGMPFFGIPIMTAAIPFQTSLAMFAVPTFTANIQQMLMGGRIRFFLRRFAWLLAAMLATIPFSVYVLVRIDQDICVLIFGVMAVSFAGLQLFPFAFAITPAQERIFNPIIGFLAGALAGVSGVYGPIVILYFMALRLPKDDFVAALAIVYFLGSFALYAALAAAKVLTLQVLGVSAAGAALIAVMVYFGQFVRRRIDEARYRKAIFLMLVVIGLDMVRRGLT